MAPRPNEPRAGSFPAPEQPVLAAPSISKPLAFVQPSSVAQGAAAGPSSVQKPAGQPLLSLPAFDGALHLAGRYDELLSLVSATRVANRAPAGFGRKYEYHVAPLSAFTAQPCAEGINVHFLHTTRKQDDWCYNCDAAGCKCNVTSDVHIMIPCHAKFLHELELTAQAEAVLAGKRKFISLCTVVTEAVPILKPEEDAKAAKEGTTTDDGNRAQDAVKDNTAREALEAAELCYTTMYQLHIRVHLKQGHAHLDRVNAAPYGTLSGTFVKQFAHELLTHLGVHSYDIHDAASLNDTILLRVPHLITKGCTWYGGDLIEQQDGVTRSELNRAVQGARDLTLTDLLDPAHNAVTEDVRRVLTHWEQTTPHLLTLSAVLQAVQAGARHHRPPQSEYLPEDQCVIRYVDYRNVKKVYTVTLEGEARRRVIGTAAAAVAVGVAGGAGEQLSDEQLAYAAMCYEHLATLCSDLLGGARGKETEPICEKDRKRVMSNPEAAPLEDRIATYAQTMRLAKMWVKHLPPETHAPLIPTTQPTAAPAPASKPAGNRKRKAEPAAAPAQPAADTSAEPDAPPAQRNKRNKRDSNASEKTIGVDVGMHTHGAAPTGMQWEPSAGAMQPRPQPQPQLQMTAEQQALLEQELAKSKRPQSQPQPQVPKAQLQLPAEQQAIWAHVFAKLEQHPHQQLPEPQPQQPQQQQQPVLPPDAMLPDVTSLLQMSQPQVPASQQSHQPAPQPDMHIQAVLDGATGSAPAPLAQGPDTHLPPPPQQAAQPMHIPAPPHNADQLGGAAQPVEARAGFVHAQQQGHGGMPTHGGFAMQHGVAYHEQQAEAVYVPQHQAHGHERQNHMVHAQDNIQPQEAAAYPPMPQAYGHQQGVYMHGAQAYGQPAYEPQGQPGWQQFQYRGNQYEAHQHQVQVQHQGYPGHQGYGGHGVQGHGFDHNQMSHVHNDMPQPQQQAGAYPPMPQAYGQQQGAYMHAAQAHVQPAYEQHQYQPMQQAVPQYQQQAYDLHAPQQLGQPLPSDYTRARLLMLRQQRMMREQAQAAAGNQHMWHIQA